MAKSGPWRVKGVDRKARRMAREAAARGGVPIGAWIDRAIRSRAGIVPRGDAKPLVPPEFLSSAWAAAAKAAPAPAAPESPKLPVPARIDPPVTAQSRPGAAMAGGAAGAVLVVALMAGGYWLVGHWPPGAPDEPRQPAVAESQAPPARAVAARPPAAAPTPVQKLIAAANSGDAAAQHDLGLMYVQGEGVARNPAVGAQWLEKSAAAGLPRAQYHLGILYEKGLGVARNDGTALAWYRRAALQGHARAQHNLATLYAEGKGTARNYAEALRWFTRASEQGLAESHYSLGLMHEHGMGVEKDTRKAAGFYRDALAAGSAEAADKLARLEPALQGSRDAADAVPEAAVAPATGAPGGATARDGSLTAAGIVSLQRLLARLDLGPGPPNGVLGPKTVDAIKLYQRFAGLPVDGKPTVALLQDLRQVVGAMSAEAAPRTTPAGKP